MLPRRKHAGEDWLEYVDVIEKNESKMVKHDKIQLARILNTLSKHTKDLKILDLGCGDGQVTELAARLAVKKFAKKRISFALVEPLSLLGKVAYKRMKQLGFAVRLTMLSGEKFFPAKESFDLVMSTRAAHHFQSLPKIIQGSHDCLNRGAFIYYDDLLRPNSKKELAHWLRRRARIINHAGSQKMAEECLLASYNKIEIKKLMKNYPGKLTFREDWLGRWNYVFRNK